MDEFNEKLKPVSEISEGTNYSSEYLTLRCRQGRLKCTKIDGKWFTSEEELALYIKNISGDQDLLSISTVANETPYSAEYLGLRCRQGKLPSVKLAGKWFVTRQAVQKYVTEQQSNKSYRLNSGVDFVTQAEEVKKDLQHTEITDAQPRKKYISNKTFLTITAVLIVALLGSFVGANDVFLKNAQAASAKILQTLHNIQLSIFGDRYDENKLVGIINNLSRSINENSNNIAMQYRELKNDIASGKYIIHEQTIVKETSPSQVPNQIIVYGGNADSASLERLQLAHGDLQQKLVIIDNRINSLQNNKIDLRPFAQSQRIDHLNGVTIASATITNSTIAGYATTGELNNYLPLSGGNITGSLGVGSSSPAGQLGVVGEVYISGTTTIDNVLNVLNTGTSTITGRLEIEGRLLADGGGRVCTSSNGVCSAASAGGWTDDGTSVRLTTITDFVGIGTSTPGRTFSVEGQELVSGTSTVGNLLKVEGTGTSTFAGRLEVTGKILAEGGQRVCTSANGVCAGASVIAGNNIDISGSTISVQNTLFSMRDIFATTTGSSVYASSTLQASGNIIGYSGIFGQSLNASTTLHATGNATLAGNTTFTNATSSSFGILGGKLTNSSSATSSFAGGISLNQLTSAHAITINGNSTSTFSGGITANSLSFNLPNCTQALETDANGAIICGTDVDTNTTYTAGHNLSLLGTTFSVNSTLVGLDDVFATSSGASVYASSTIQATGNILGYSSLGIGTTTPGRTLSIGGQSLVTGTSTIGNLITVQGTGTSTIAGRLEVAGRLLADGGGRVCTSSNGVCSGSFTSFTAAGDTGSDSITNSETLTLVGGRNITTVGSTNQVLFDLNNALSIDSLTATTSLSTLGVLNASSTSHLTGTTTIGASVVVSGGATSTFFGGVSVGRDGLASAGGLTLTGGIINSQGTGTSSFAGGISLNQLTSAHAITVNGNSTSTFSGGISANSLSFNLPNCTQALET
ncbi:MAG: hypothetical protein AAB482_01695, partial [Patescibacteria group bacterium]